MTFSQIMNSPLMYILAMLGIGYVLLFSVFTLMRSYRHALAVGLDKKKVRGVIASSALYSVVPSLSIVVGLFSLATNVLSLAMLCAYVPIQVMNGPLFAAVLLTSLSVAALHKWIIKTFGCKWLNNFVMADSLLISMASSLLWLKLFG